MKRFKDILDPSLKIDRRRAYVSFILHVLGAASAVALASMLGPAPTVKLVKKLVKFGVLERKRLKQTLQRLERRGLVRRQKRDDGNEYLFLTEAGERVFLQEKQRMLSLPRPSHWDRVWRIIIFDIVENKKNVRDAVRKHLRKLGFYHLQKSVFVVPYPCKEEIRFLQKFYEGESEICLIEAISLGEKESLVRAHFKL